MKQHKIEPESFYGQESLPQKGARERIWNNIYSETSHARYTNSGFDFRNFAFGFATAIFTFFFVAGVYFTGERLISGNKSQNLILSETYSNAVDNFERALPVILEDTSRETRVDELINVKREELDTLSGEIRTLKAEISSSSRSDLKYQRLVNLYRMKMKIIDSILELEEKRK